jgi:hypothetical protein
MTFNVTLTGTSSQTITVSYASGGGTAVAGSDYSTAMGSVTFAPGVTQQTIAVTISGDTTDESNETFNLTLSVPGGTTNVALDTKSVGVGTILNDDTTLPTVSISNASGSESGSLTFNVTVSAQASGNVSVNWTLVPINAKTADFAVNQPMSGTLTWTSTGTSAERTKALTISLFNDTLDELNETFEIHLSNPSSNVTIFNGTGTGTILDDDPTPSIYIGGVTQSEGNSGQTAFTFTVTIYDPVALVAIPSGRVVTVDFTTQDDTATVSDNDYVATNGTLQIPEGQTTGQITVFVIGDTKNENGVERFNVVLSNAQGANITNAAATGQIKNDD